MDFGRLVFIFVFTVALILVLLATFSFPYIDSITFLNVSVNGSVKHLGAFGYTGSSETHTVYRPVVVILGPK
jgi:hypothetical protein